MKLRFLGTDSVSGQSPTLYATDHDTYVVQGWKTSRPAHVEIPYGLLKYLEPGICLGAPLTDSGGGNFILAGAPLTDPDALAAMNIPGHEDAVEVSVSAVRRPDAAPRL